MQSTHGYVYILSNQSMPGIYKIGRSIYGGEKRAKEIYRNATGVPLPFKLEFEIYSNDCVELEILVHEALQESRVNIGREFFRAKNVSSIIIKIIGIEIQNIDEKYCVTSDSVGSLECDIGYFAHRNNDCINRSCAYISIYLEKHWNNVYKYGRSISLERTKTRGLQMGAKLS